MSLVEVEEKELAQLRIRAEHQAQVLEKNKTVEKYRVDYQCKKDSSLAAKKRLDEALAELSALIADGPTAQMSLPFDDGKTVAAVETPSIHWREKSIEDLNLPKGTTEKLIELGINTIGKLKDIDDCKVPGYDDGMASIPNWGRGKVERAKIALATVCGHEPDFTSDVPDEEPKPDPVAETPELAAQADDQQLVTVQLVSDIAGCQQFGFTAGATFQGKVSGQSVVVDNDGRNVTLMATEYRIVDSEPMQETIAESIESEPQVSE